LSASIRPDPLAYPALKPPLRPRRAYAPLHPDVRLTVSTQLSLFLIPRHPLRPIQKYIAFHRGGFLQVAVSGAPRLAAAAARLRRGALQIQH
jgi:hypothetical protein